MAEQNPSPSHGEGRAFVDESRCFVRVPDGIANHVLRDMVVSAEHDNAGTCSVAPLAFFCQVSRKYLFEARTNHFRFVEDGWLLVTLTQDDRTAAEVRQPNCVGGETFEHPIKAALPEELRALPSLFDTNRVNAVYQVGRLDKAKCNPAFDPKDKWRHRHALDRAYLMFPGLFRKGHQGVHKAKDLVADNRADLTVGRQRLYEWAVAVPHQHTIVPCGQRRPSGRVATPWRREARRTCQRAPLHMFYGKPASVPARAD